MQILSKKLIKPVFLQPSMASLTKEENAVLKILLEKELNHVKKDGQGFLISNASFLSKTDDPDLSFLEKLKALPGFLRTIKEEAVTMADENNVEDRYMQISTVQASQPGTDCRICGKAPQRKEEIETSLEA